MMVFFLLRFRVTLLMWLMSTAGLSYFWDGLITGWDVDSDSIVFVTRFTSQMEVFVGGASNELSRDWDDVKWIVVWAKFGIDLIFHLWD